MKNSVFEHSIDDYAKECGVNKKNIAPHSAAFAYHGGGNYINGTYASYAISMLNALIGNVNRKGGYLLLKED
ncbi:hypothetical protein [Lebetimonas sp. JH292]|uniref:hypothetical protein n=1 Tax=Lebetimonas sp. JH292 TaxID=990068 RepID=UPI00046660A8|nr:hypothetical protein [Lebetimonas sp. JH292]